MRAPHPASMALVVAAAAVLAGCVAAAPSPTEGASATWQLADASAILAESTTVDVDVTRTACSGGVTGDVLEPVVEYEPDRVVVRIDVAPIDDKLYSCPGGAGVPVTVELTEPLGQRALVDGGCFRPEASGTSGCVVPERLPAPLPAPPG